MTSSQSPPEAVSATASSPASDEPEAVGAWTAADRRPDLPSGQHTMPEHPLQSQESPDRASSEPPESPSSDSSLSPSARDSYCSVKEETSELADLSAAPATPGIPETSVPAGVNEANGVLTSSMTITGEFQCDPPLREHPMPHYYPAAYEEPSYTDLDSAKAYDHPADTFYAPLSAGCPQQYVPMAESYTGYPPGSLGYMETPLVPPGVVGYHPGAPQGLTMAPVTSSQPTTRTRRSTPHTEPPGSKAAKNRGWRGSSLSESGGTMKLASCTAALLLCHCYLSLSVSLLLLLLLPNGERIGSL